MKLHAEGAPVSFGEDLSALYLAAPVEQAMTMADAITYYLDHIRGGKLTGFDGPAVFEMHRLIASHLMSFVHHNIWTFEFVMRKSVMLAVEFPSHIPVRAVSAEGKAYDVPLKLIQYGQDIPRFVRKARVPIPSPEGMREPHPVVVMH